MAWHSVWTTSFWPLGTYTSDNVKDNATEVYTALTSAGWTHNAACAVIGNLIHESTGINPGQFEGGYNYSLRHGFGIAQWTPGSKVTNYIGSTAQGVADDGAKQVQFLLNTPGQWYTGYLNSSGYSNYYGVSAPYYASMAAFSAATDSVAELTKTWAICWERPAASGAGFSTRQQYAAYYSAYFGEPEPGTYHIYIVTSGNGTASASPSSAAEGTTITLTESPESGAEFSGWESDDVTIVNNSFTMPAKNVTIKAVFTGETPGPSPGLKKLPIWLLKWKLDRR